jgi:hypothetical protein
MNYEKAFASYEKWGNKLDQAYKDHAFIEDVRAIIAKAPLAALHYLEFWNMGWSGVSPHPYIEFIKDEILKRYEV